MANERIPLLSGSAINHFHFDDRTSKSLRPSPAWHRGIAEAVGTFVLIMIGCAGNAQLVLGYASDGGYLAMNLAWGAGVALGELVWRRRLDVVSFPLRRAGWGAGREKK